MDQMDDSYRDAFKASYVTAALWSSTDEQGTPLDRRYSALDIHEDSLRTMHIECDAFITAYVTELLEHGSPSQAGHDFWLTRNGHGAGFWDRGLGKLGDALTAAAESCGTSDLYVGDDGQVHVA